MKQTIILGIDPGCHITGYAIVKREERKAFIVDFGYLQLSSRKSLVERVGIFYHFFQEKISAFNISQITLETPFLGKNAQTFLKLGYLRGILYLLTNEHKLSLAELSPREVKQSITGFGGATKEQVARALTQLFPVLSTVASTARNDVTDAIAICICGLWKKQQNYLQKA